MFHSNPNITKGDYEFIRKLSNLNGGSINIYTPFVILVNESGSTLTATDVIGNSSSSFRFVLPQTILYCTLRDTKQHDKMKTQTQAYELSSQPTVCHTNSKGTSLDRWHRVLVGLRFHDKIELKRRHITKCEEHTLLPKCGETTMKYIQGYGQRIPLSGPKNEK